MFVVSQHFLKSRRSGQMFFLADGLFKSRFSKRYVVKEHFFCPWWQAIHSGGDNKDINKVHLSDHVAPNSKSLITLFKRVISLFPVQTQHGVSVIL